MNPEIFAVAKILTDKSCSQMLILFMDGKFHTVTELAKVANIKNNTATYHIKKLEELNWLEKYTQGRFHYYRLCSNVVAQIIEQLLPISKIKPARSLNYNKEQQILFQGRTCYDHLAGKLGVELTKWLFKQNFVVEIEKEVDLTRKGVEFFGKCGVNIELLKKQKRHFCKMCMDWSEREYHIAGSVGKALADCFFRNGWIESFGKSRGVRLTKKGENNLLDCWNAKDIVDSCKQDKIFS